MDISYQKAWERSGYYLLACSGFPTKSKYKLKKTGQTYHDILRQHKVMFTLTVDQPTMISETSTEIPVGYREAVKKQKDEAIETPFKLLRELIDILEIKAKEKAVEETKPEDFEWDVGDQVI